jgi:hypothetical protein
MLSGSNGVSALIAIAIVSCAVLAGSSASFEREFVAMPTPVDARAFVLSCQDLDADGFFGEPDCGTLRDCNDSSAATYPGAPEICDGYDNDCDAELDDDSAFDSICDLPDRIGGALGVTDAGAVPHGLPSLVWTGAEYRVSWQDTRNGFYDIYFARLDTTGNKIGTTCA